MTQPPQPQSAVEAAWKTVNKHLGHPCIEALVAFDIQDAVKQLEAAIREECAAKIERRADFGPNGDATTPGFFKATQ